MRPPPSSSPSSLPPASSISLFERYEKIFNGCGGCIADDEQEPVASAILYQHSSDERDEQQQSTQPTEAISNNWSSYQKARRRQQESAPSPVGTVLLNQPTSYYEIDKFDIDERTSRRQQSKTRTQTAKVKAQTEEATVNEFFNGIKKLPMTDGNQSQIMQIMAIPASPPTTIMTQQQQRREPHCHHITPIQSNKTVTAVPPPTLTSTKPFSPKTLKPPSSSPKTRLQQYDMFQVVMPSSFRSSLKGPTGRHRHEGNLKYIASDSTQSTQSLSESDDDISWGLEDAEERQPQQEQEQDTPVVSILRRKVKLGTSTITDTNTNANAKNDNHVRVRFEQDTKFPDPNERPSSTRKHEPRMSPKQKQEYMMMHTYYQPTTDHRQRQLDSSSLLMAAATGPSLVIAPHTNNHDEFRDYSVTATKNSPTNNMMCSRHHESDYRQKQRLARRAQQKQYHHHHHHHQRSHSSAVAEELLLSQYMY